MSYDEQKDQIATADHAKIAETFAGHRIYGTVTHAIGKGINPELDAPLAQQVEDGLWQGGCIHGVELPHDFDHVVSLYPWGQYQLGPDTTREEHKLFDSLDQDLDSDFLSGLVSDISDRLDAGQKVLIHCQAGLNRSGLLTALVLIRRGRSAREAIDLLRTQRSPLVLCNDTFEAYLLSLEDTPRE